MGGHKLVDPLFLVAATGQHERDRGFTAAGGRGSVSAPRGMRGRLVSVLHTMFTSIDNFHYKSQYPGNIPLV